MFDWYKSMWHFKPVAFSFFTAGVEMRTRQRDNRYTSNWLYVKWGCRSICSVQMNRGNGTMIKGPAHTIKWFFNHWLFFIYRYSLHLCHFTRFEVRADWCRLSRHYLFNPTQDMFISLHSASMWWLRICPLLREAPLYRVWGVQSAIPWL